MTFHVTSEHIQQAHSDMHMFKVVSDNVVSDNEHPTSFSSLLRVESRDFLSRFWEFLDIQREDWNEGRYLTYEISVPVESSFSSTLGLMGTKDLESARGLKQITLGPSTILECSVPEGTRYVKGNYHYWNRGELCILNLISVEVLTPIRVV